jgi:hypothetical protein
MYPLANKISQALWRLGQYDRYTLEMIYLVLGFAVFLMVG